jgi:16S rRNA (cytosine967-C5)-methyltransferase
LAAFRALRLLSDRAMDLGEALRRARDPLTDVRDRALTTDLVTGTLRWRGAIDYQLAARLSRPLTRTDAVVVDALRLGAYQLLHLDRVPAAAVVHDSVELVKRSRVASAAPLVNAVLRRLARDRGALSWPSRPATVDDAASRAALVTYLAVVHSHPAWLVDRWLARYGAAETEAWLTFNNQPPELTLAPNRTRLDRDSLAAQLEAEGIASLPTLIAPHGLRTGDSRVLASESYRKGNFVIQDEASQIVPELAAAAPGARVFDACAAPGGKTLALAAQTGVEGLVVAADVRPHRVRVLRETLGRTTPPRVSVVYVSHAGPLPFADRVFDVVLVDAPCSGLGTVRRDPDIRWRRIPQDLERFAQRQIELLGRTGRLVKPSGRLIFSTCSSEPDENEAVVSAFCADHPEFVVVPLDRIDGLWAPVVRLMTPEGYLRTAPRHGLEAFFGAALQRTR